MLTDLIRDHARLIAEVRALEEKIERERTTALAALPETFGFSDLGSFIRAVKDAAKPAHKAKAVRRAPKPAPKQQAAKVTPAPPPPTDYPGLAAAKTPEPVKVQLPTGTSLDDPANFGVMPDTTLLERGTQSRENFIETLGQALRFTQKVLHTSKVTAKVWWEWRQFERSAIEAIQAAKEDLRSAEDSTGH